MKRRLLIKMTRNMLREKLELVAEGMTNVKNEAIDEVCKIGIIDIENWEWAQGVGLYGMFRYYEKTKDEAVLEWICNWIEGNLKKRLPDRNVNTTAPMLTVWLIGNMMKNDKYLELGKDWADWIMKKMPRTKHGGFQHVVTGEYNNQQLWDDTLFMTVLFLAATGGVENNQEYLAECERQFLIHTMYLQDKKTGLWYHGWTFEDNNNFANALWGRGNSWITAFIPDYLEIVGDKISLSVKNIMIEVLNSQVEALEKYQDEGGMWHTLIDDENSYLEASATAGFAYGILKSIRIGILDEKYKEVGIKAAQAVIDCIDENGVVQNVSYGTGMGKSLQAYRDIPICPMAYGQAMTIMMLSELISEL